MMERLSTNSHYEEYEQKPPEMGGFHAYSYFVSGTMNCKRPKATPAVNSALQIIMPTDIHNISFFVGAPSEIPIAAPSGAPVNSGEARPRPTTPYLSHICHMRPCRLLRFSTRFKSQLRKEPPTKITAPALMIAPTALKIPIRTGGSCNIKPTGIAAHSSNMPDSVTEPAFHNTSILFRLSPLAVFFIRHGKDEQTCNKVTEFGKLGCDIPTDKGRVRNDQRCYRPYTQYGQRERQRHPLNRRKCSIEIIRKLQIDHEQVFGRFPG